MSQREIISLIEQNPGIYQIDLVRKHGFEASLIAKMAYRKQISRELTHAPGFQNKVYKLYPINYINNQN